MLKSFEFLATMEDEVKGKGAGAQASAGEGSGEEDEVVVKVHKRVSEKGDHWEQVIDLCLKRNAAKRIRRRSSSRPRTLGIAIKGLRHRVKIGKRIARRGRGTPLPDKGKITVSQGGNTATGDVRDPPRGIRPPRCSGSPSGECQGETSSRCS